MFEGAMTAMVTPFDREGKVDEEGLRENVRFQIKKGVHGLVPVGTTGECATLSYEEHNRVVDVVVDAAKGKVPVLAGTGSNSTWEATMLTKHAKEVGADGALLVVPYYNKPTQAGLYQHYKRIAEEVDLPQVIYNIPSRTSLNMLPETMAKLAKVKNIVGVKEASGDLKQIARIIELAGKEFSVISGDDPLTLEIMKLGGVGIISVTSNLVPDKLVKMVDSFRSGDVQTAKRINDELAPLFKALFIETNPGPAKMAMNWMGMAGAGGLRLPLVELEPENQEKLRKVLVDMGLVK